MPISEHDYSPPRNPRLTHTNGSPATFFRGPEAYLTPALTAEPRHVVRFAALVSLRVGTRPRPSTYA